MNTGLLADLLIAFNLGLASQLHCAGMCGGIVAALALGMTPAAGVPGRHLALALACNAGRILAYATAGAALALVAGILIPVDGRGHGWLRVLAGCTLVASGLSLAGFFRRVAWLELAGLPLWRRVQPLARRLLPLRRWPQALAFGFLWGWLPCALVYASLLVAATRGDATQAAAVMLAFGAGTLPLMLASTWLAATAPAWCRQPVLRRLAGVLLITGGLAYPLLAPDHPQAPAPAGMHRH